MWLEVLNRRGLNQPHRDDEAKRLHHNCIIELLRYVRALETRISVLEGHPLPEPLVITEEPPPSILQDLLEEATKPMDNGRQIVCHHPDHNSEDGCGNPMCWKHPDNNDDYDTYLNEFRDEGNR